jgi:4-diphosphocytidyl-2-C-methyl-D-erythritol kinase
LLYRCYAKVNLTLEILGKRADGFHELASLVHTINLADDLRVEPADALLTRVEGMAIDPETNLVARAAEQLSLRLKDRQGAELSLLKRIPAAAGLGGGSSDAATTLAALNVLWGTRLSLRQLMPLAAGLGSDVPFFMRGGAALMRGRGEELAPLPPRIGQWLVLLVPTHDVQDKTRRLYASLQPDDFTSGELTSRAAQRLKRREALEPSELVNAFERAARGVFPGLSETWEQAERLCQRKFFLSGAGPALFAVAAGRADARGQAAALARVGGAAYAVRTVNRARTSIRFARTDGIEYA